VTTVVMSFIQSLARAAAVLPAGLSLCVAAPGAAAFELGVIPGIPALQQAEALFAENKYRQALPLYKEAMQMAQAQAYAHGRLAEIALRERDAPALRRLFAAYRAYPFEAPENFQTRVQYYEIGRLRAVYNQAIQAAQNRQWARAEQGFAQLLGDPAMHRQAISGLYRAAMLQNDFERAGFLSQFAEEAGDDAASSARLMRACAEQRVENRSAAFSAIKDELVARGASSDNTDQRVRAQREVYLGLIRLHVQFNQCFLGGWSTISEARPFFPDLADPVLSYLARR